MRHSYHCGGPYAGGTGDTAVPAMVVIAPIRTALLGKTLVNRAKAAAAHRRVPGTSKAADGIVETESDIERQNGRQTVPEFNPANPPPPVANGHASTSL